MLVICPECLIYQKKLFAKEQLSNRCLLEWINQKVIQNQNFFELKRVPSWEETETYFLEKVLMLLKDLLPVQTQVSQLELAKSEVREAVAKKVLLNFF